MNMRIVELLLAFLVILSLCTHSLEAQLVKGFYNDLCPEAETIVGMEVLKAFLNDSGLAAGLVRMHFHDAFVRGADGSVLIDSTSNSKAEKDAPPNNPSLRGFEVIDNAKAKLEAECKGKVSCADILAFAARDSILLDYSMKSQQGGDGNISLASEALANLPPPIANLDQLTRAFATKNLTQEEMIILSGAHTIGRSNCTSFMSRLYNFNSTGRQDPSLDPAYAQTLKQKCPNSTTGAVINVVPMDPLTPTSFDSNYYKGILINRGLFTSDQTLISSEETKKMVQKFASLPTPSLTKKFAHAFVKMGSFGVLTGDEGEIRANCRVIN